MLSDYLTFDRNAIGAGEKLFTDSDARAVRRCRKIVSGEVIG